MNKYIKQKRKLGIAFIAIITLAGAIFIFTPHVNADSTSQINSLISSALVPIQNVLNSLQSTVSEHGNHINALQNHQNINENSLANLQNKEEDNKSKILQLQNIVGLNGTSKQEAGIIASLLDPIRKEITALQNHQAEQDKAILSLQNATSQQSDNHAHELDTSYTGYSGYGYPGENHSQIDMGFNFFKRDDATHTPLSDIKILVSGDALFGYYEEGGPFSDVQFNSSDSSISVSTPKGILSQENPVQVTLHFILTYPNGTLQYLNTVINAKLDSTNGGTGSSTVIKPHTEIINF